MIQDTDQLGTNDLSKHRIVELSNGNKINLERRDPYGFIHVWLDHGQFPDKSPLNGVFTSWERAYTAIDGYIAQRNEAVSQIRHIAPEAFRDTVGEVQHAQSAKETEDTAGFTTETTNEAVVIKKPK